MDEKFAMKVKKNQSALIVDDDPLIRTVEQHMLAKHGFKITVAKNGKEAVDIFIAGNSFDLILMDMEMPVMNGIQATKELRALGVKSLIYGVTASDSKSDIQAFIEAGLDEYVKKPLSFTKLDDILKKLN